MLPGFQEFSAGYYIMSPMYAEPHEDIPVPRINDRIYQFLQGKVYRAFTRVILKVNKVVFEVEPSNRIPVETLAGPEEFIEDTLDVSNPPSEIEVFVPKKTVAERYIHLDDGRDVLGPDDWPWE